MNRFLSLFLLLTFSIGVFAQTETPPAPSAPRSVAIPAVSQKELANGLTVATVERKNVPLVTVQLVFSAGANSERSEDSGLANLTASMLTKGTRTRSATQLAEQIEFLGGSINSGAGWNNSTLTVSVMSDKLDAAMAILSDAALNSKFDAKELKLMKSQTLDGLAYNLKQAGFLATYATNSFSFDEHPAGGTPESISKLKLSDLLNFKKTFFTPNKAVLIFAGDVTPEQSSAVAQKYFGRWRSNWVSTNIFTVQNADTAGKVMPSSSEANPLVRRILVVDLPDSGQSSVGYNVLIKDGRTMTNDPDYVNTNPVFYPALVMNSVLGGGYSSRLNQEIRIKRGLSYGAGSSFSWRGDHSNFSARTQTKNESAAEVAELIVAEIARLRDTEVPASELSPRKLVLSGDFGRDLETTGGLAASLTSLYTFGLSPVELNTHIGNINLISSSRVKAFSEKYLKRGDIVIVGDYKVFKDDLAKRFPGMKIEVVPASKYSAGK